jgi:hypothetical protein
MLDPAQRELPAHREAALTGADHEYVCLHAAQRPSGWSIEGANGRRRAASNLTSLPLSNANCPPAETQGPKYPSDPPGERFSVGFRT